MLLVLTLCATFTIMVRVKFEKIDELCCCVDVSNFLSRCCPRSLVVTGCAGLFVLPLFECFAHWLSICDLCVCFCVLVLFCVVARDLFVFVLHFAIVCPRVCVVFDFTDFVFFCFLPFRWALCFSVLSPFLFDCCCTSCMSLTFLNVTRCFDVKSDFCWLSCIVKQRSFVKCFFV